MQEIDYKKLYLPQNVSLYDSTQIMDSNPIKTAIVVCNKLIREQVYAIIVSKPERMVELAELRRQLVPRTVTQLHTLLHTTGQFSRSIGLADLVASEQHFLYSAFSQQDLTELLTKIRESSLAAMDQGKDPWGFNKV